MKPAERLTSLINHLNEGELELIAAVVEHLYLRKVQLSNLSALQTPAAPPAVEEPPAQEAV